jgi:hypothetical protein
VPAAGDDWYQRRRQDAEGVFFRKVADQGPRKGLGGSTRQGIYCFTASGKLLAYKNAQNPRVMRETLELGLKRWKALPASERDPGAVKVPAAGKVDLRYSRTPPPGGLILRSYTRILDREEGKYIRGVCPSTGGDRPARDHVWLTKEEWQALVPATPREGQTMPLAPALTRRLVRFHLLDNTRGEPARWRAEEVRKASLTWKVTAVTAGEVRMELTGTALLSTDADLDKAKRGYDVALRGELRYDRAKKAITRLDLLAVGEHWGHSMLTGGSRPGRKPLGIAFELVTGTSPADLVPPQAAREVAAYFASK